MKKHAPYIDCKKFTYFKDKLGEKWAKCVECKFIICVSKTFDD